MGTAYANGTGVTKDDVEAVKWFLKAAEQGDAQSQHNLGAVYADGTGVTKDDVEAAKWCRKAAEQGHTQAQLHLSVLYFNGSGVPMDSVEAYKWANLSAAKGNEDAKEIRRLSEAKMTPDQIAEAQKLSREFKPVIEGESGIKP